jgi:hypothetical protein
MSKMVWWFALLFHVCVGLTPLRYMSANVGNACVSGGCCWEDKLCSGVVAGHLSSFIQKFEPDVVLLMEVLRRTQVPSICSSSVYAFDCGASLNRFNLSLASFNATNASHEHECVCWKLDRFALQASTSADGRNDDYGKQHCHFDFTGFAVTLLDKATEDNITFVAVHPDSMQKECKLEEIARYWELAKATPKAVVAGDWNSGRKCVLGACRDSIEDMQIPASFRSDYLVGKHADGVADSPLDCCPTAVYVDGAQREWLDAAFSNFGQPNTSVFPHGSAVGSYNGIPRADGGQGCDHRQLLVDLVY